MKPSILFAVALSCLLLVGCKTVEYDFPSDIKDFTYGAMWDARDCMREKLGGDVKKESSCELIKVMTCDKKASSGYWCWYDPTWKMYVGGLAGSHKIWVGCNPKTGGEVHYGVCRHEFGHHWDTANGIGGGMHNPIFKTCFINWNDPPRVTMLVVGVDAKTEAEIKIAAKEAYDDGEDGDWVSVTTFDEKGQELHYDFVVIRDP